MPTHPRILKKINNDYELT